jgi:hypothetical protein
MNLKTLCFDRTQPQRAHLFPVYRNSALKNVCSTKIIVKHKEVWKPNTQIADSFISFQYTFQLPNFVGWWWCACIPVAKFRGVVNIQHLHPRACSPSLFKETFMVKACHPRNIMFSRYIFLQSSLLFQNTLQRKSRATHNLNTSVINPHFSQAFVMRQEQAGQQDDNHENTLPVKYWCTCNTEIFQRSKTLPGFTLNV